MGGLTKCLSCGIKEDGRTNTLGDAQKCGFTIEFNTKQWAYEEIKHIKNGFAQKGN